MEKSVSLHRYRLNMLISDHMYDTFSIFYLKFSAFSAHVITTVARIKKHEMSLQHLMKFAYQFIVSRYFLEVYRL